MAVNPALAATISASGEDQELWEVIVAPDDIKLLTLEQLDDYFRLDVIGVSTLVRQQGTSAWQRLGVVAGIESEASGLQLDDALPAFARPKPGRTAAPSFAAAAHPFWNAGAVAEPVIPLLDPAALAAPVRAEPLLEPPSFDSLTRAEPQRPAAPIPIPSYRAPAIHAYSAPQRSSAGFVVVVIAAFLGIVCVAHRNDFLRLGAHRIGLETKYLALEKKLGGPPGFGTPRSLEAFLSELGDGAGPAAAADSGAAPATKATASATAPGKSAVVSRPASGDGSKAVSLDALPVLAPEATKRDVSAPTPRAAAAPPARAEAASAAKPASAAGKAPAEKIQLDEAPARPKKPENPLNAAIRAAMEKQNKAK